MSQQKSLHAFFTVRKRPVDQHAAKRRKVLLDETSTISKPKEVEVDVLNLLQRPAVKLTQDAGPGNSGEASHRQGTPVNLVVGSTTSIVDDHLLSPIIKTPQSTKNQPENTRRRKRDQAGDPPNVEENDKVLFTLGRKTTAKKKLDLDHTIEDMKKSQVCSPIKTVPFFKEGNLSPVKNLLRDSRDVKLQGDRVLKALSRSPLQSPSKLTPQEVKLKLGTVSKLADLQAKLKLLSSETTAVSSSHKRALFGKPEPSLPKLSQKSIILEVEKNIKSKPLPSPIKASPRKAVLESTIKSDLQQPDRRLPLPSKYKFIANVFDILDQIVGMKHNRQEVIRVENIKPAVEKVLRKTMTDGYLKQIRCVFPSAYNFAWERVRDRMGRETSNYELIMEVNLEYNNGKQTQEELNQEEKKKSIFKNLSPVAKSERLKIFMHNLLTIVQDHHKQFLEDQGIFVGQEKAWSEKFDIEALPDIDEVDFPAKPESEKFVSAQELIQRLGPGLNPRLESVLKQRTEGQAKLEEKKESPVKEVKIIKGLQGLSPHILELIKAKEKAKQIKNITLSTQEQKEIQMMEELVDIAPLVVNCHRSQRNGAAVPSEALFKVAADSHGRKSMKEMEELIRLFIKLVPECMEFKIYEKVEYIKLKKPGPDNNQIRIKIEKLTEAKKK